MLTDCGKLFFYSEKSDEFLPSANFSDFCGFIKFNIFLKKDLIFYFSCDIISKSYGEMAELV